MFKILLMQIIVILLSITTIQYVHGKRIRKNEFLGLSSQNFAADVFPKLDKGNQLIAPMLIQSGLSLLPVHGMTKNQLINTLHLSNMNFWANSYKKFLSSVKYSKDIEIEAGSGLYVSNKVRYFDTYKDMFSKYGTKLESVDFSKSEKVAKDINEWVEHATHKKIKNIVDAASLKNTVALIISALYFNAEWEKPFLNETTFSKVFYSHGKTEERINMMMQSGKFNYAENKELDAKFLELPYKNTNYRMTIVLPNKLDGLANLEQQLDKVFAKQNMTLSEVIMNIPKFKFENKVTLTDVFRKLGLASIIDDGISMGPFNRKLKINNIIQKTYIDVTEAGTEAAVVVEVEMSNRFGVPITESFIADHPFLFFIKQESTGAILFLGRFTNPE